MATIIIDPGHGGSSDLHCSAANHARGPVHGTLEKNLTLDVALRVKREFDRRGGNNVLLTRDRDVNVTGVDRALMARTHSADVLVSIHFNASTGHNAQGTETFVHTAHSNTGSSAHLCRCIQAALLRATGVQDRNRFHPPHFIKKAGWCVINPGSHASRTAAVLAEVSFLDRADEEQRLQRDSYKDEIAISIVEGIENYLAPAVQPEAVVAAYGGQELEDAVSEAAAAARISVEEMMGFGAALESAPVSYALRGHHLADEAVRADDVTEAAVPPLVMVARALAGLSENAQAGSEDENDRWEAGGINAPDAIDLAYFGRDEAADAQLLATTFTGYEAALSSFDHDAFARFITGLGLRYFMPVEFLFLGGRNQPGATCAGRNDLPPPGLWPNIAKTARMLDEIRHRLGAPVRLLSIYRNASYNSCIEGERGSLHMKFNAIDWTCSSGSVSTWRDVARAVRSSNPEFEGGVGYYPASRFIHIDTRGYPANW